MPHRPSIPLTLHPDFEALLARLDDAPPEPASVHRQAAVAALLRRGASGPEVLLMRRAEQERDRWSGQVSLPGGAHEPEDRDLWDTARRETREEVGLDLARDARAIARLPRIRAMARGRTVGLEVTPFVFLQQSPAEPALGPEAAAVFWLPLADAASGALDHRQLATVGGTELLLPAWRLDEHTVWGLTHRMLSGLIALLREH